jgi:tetratricopeptide (TPR) repeat protein
VAESRVEELRRRLGRDPGSRLFAQLAEETRKTGDLAEAIRVARAGLAVHPTYPAALVTLGRALLDSGDLRGACTALEEAVRQAPHNLQAGRLLGEALARAGDVAGAVRRYRALLEMAPLDGEIAARVAELEGGGRQEGATARTASAASAATVSGASGTGEGPVNSETDTVAGVGPGQEKSARNPAAGNDGCPPEGAGRQAPVGERGADAGRKEGPPLSSATLGELYLKQGFLDRAIEVYRQVVAQHPRDERARLRLAELVSGQLREEAEEPDPTQLRRRGLERTIRALELLLGVARRG